MVRFYLGTHSAVQLFPSYKCLEQSARTLQHFCKNCNTTQNSSFWWFHLKGVYTLGLVGLNFSVHY